MAEPTEAQKTLKWANGVCKAAVLLNSYLEEGHVVSKNHKLVIELRKAIWEEDKQNG